MLNMSPGEILVIIIISIIFINPKDIPKIIKNIRSTIEKINHQIYETKNNIKESWIKVDKIYEKKNEKKIEK